MDTRDTSERSCSPAEAATEPAQSPSPGSYLDHLRTELSREMQLAGYNSPDLVKATTEFFDREVKEYGPQPAAVFFALFINRLCCHRLRKCPTAGRQFGGDEADDGNSSVPATDGPPHGPPIQNQVSDDEAYAWRQSAKMGV